MSTVSTAPPVRTGKCSLVLVIDGRRYRVSPAPPVGRGSKIWHLRVCPGQIRAGKVYSVCAHKGSVECTCPDATRNKAVCKHSRALQALGLVPKSAKPAALADWEKARSAARRFRPAAPLALPAPASAAEKPAKPALARRRHVANILPPAEFAQGWNDAVRARLAGMKGGAL